MLSSVGRPREHDDRTRVALITAAEELVAQGGPDALSVRAVAQRAGTTTRAVYSLFESKDGLVAALAQRAFELLLATVTRLPESEDPAADLVDAGVLGFRRLVSEHPALYRIAFQRVVPGLQPRPGLADARGRAISLLTHKVQRLEAAGLLDAKSPREAVIEFNAMCEGLANAELRGAILRILPEGEEERAWRDGLGTVVRGFGATGSLRDRRP